MKLSVLERLVLLNVLPAQGTVTTIRIVSDLRKALSFSEAEHKKLKFNQLNDGTTRWEARSLKDKEIDIGSTAQSIISEALKELSVAEKMTADLLSVWDKFVKDKDD